MQPSQPEASPVEESSKVDEPADVEEAVLLSSPAFIAPEDSEKSAATSAEVHEDVNLLDLEEFGPMMM